MEVESSGGGEVLLAFGVDLEHGGGHAGGKRAGVPVVAREKIWKVTE